MPNKNMNLPYKCSTENAVEAAGTVTNKTGNVRIT